jgi:hypothetical protein
VRLTRVHRSSLLSELHDRLTDDTLPGIPYCILSLLLLLSLCIYCTAGFGAPTARSALEDVTVMQQAIQHGGDSGAVERSDLPTRSAALASANKGREKRAYTTPATFVQRVLTEHNCRN